MEMLIHLIIEVVNQHMDMIVAFVLSPVAVWLQGDIFKSLKINKRLKNLLRVGTAILISLLMAVFSYSFEAFNQQNWSWDSYLANFAVVLSFAQVFYQSYFKQIKNGS